MFESLRGTKGLVSLHGTLGVVGVALALGVLQLIISVPYSRDVSMRGTYLRRLNVTLLQNLLDDVVLVLGAEFVL
jgi:hypothetical protein